MLIVIGAEKGGTGKTMIAVNLAAEAAAAGSDTLLVDADGQQSAARWTNRRRQAHPKARPITCVSMRGRIRDDLQSVRRRYDTVIVDVGGADSEELRDAATLADVLVVPVQPEALDLWTLPTVAAIATRARAQNRRLRLIVAVNRIPFQAAKQAPQQVADFIAESVARLAPAAIVPIISRAAFGRAAAEGLAAAELRAHRDYRAERDIANLYAEVMRK